MKLFESLKRLFEPRARPPVETIGAPTAGRPPPPEPTLRQRPEPPQPPQSEPAPRNAIPIAEVPVQDEAQDVLDDTSDVSEVRALLEAVAEEPEPAATVVGPSVPPEPTPTLFDEPTPAVVDVPAAARQQMGDALVLTLATPPATFTVVKTPATIGRGQENTIRLDDLSVSRRHARIAYKQGGYWLSDTGSMGGTWVDGTRLNAPYRIGAGQIIDIGLCRLTASFAAGTASEGKSTDKKETARKARSEIAGQARRRR